MVRRRPGLVLAAPFLVVAGMASAQVTVNPGALELLPAKPAPRPAAPARHPPVAARAPARPGTPAVPPTPTPAPETAVAPVKPPVVPVIPPAILALPPPAPVPAPRAQTPPIVAVAPDAPGTATPIKDGVRITFGAERADLNPATEQSLRALARTVKGQEQVPINVYAYAAGTADDVSTSRRLALARALSARAVLITEGIASTRIYPRALGATGGDAGADRVDVVTGPAGPPIAAPPVLPPATPAAAPK